MKQLTKLLFLLVWFLAITGCEKTALEELPVEDPVFFLSGEVDQETFLFEAGISDYYQYTKVGEVDNLILHEGYLQPICNEQYCGPGIAIRIYNKDRSSLASILSERELSYYFNESGVPGMNFMI